MCAHFCAVSSAIGQRFNMTTENRKEIKKSAQEEYEKLSDCQNDQLEEARAELLRHYVDLQTSQSTHLIGFVAGIFTLVSAVSSNDRLFKVFTEGSGIIISFQLPQWLGFWLFYGAVMVLLFFVLRSVFRFTVFGYLSVYVVLVTQNDIGNAQEPPVISRVQVATAARLRTANRKSFGFPAMWFLATSDGNEECKGWVVCALLALVFSAILIGLIW